MVVVCGQQPVRLAGVHCKAEKRVNQTHARTTFPLSRALFQAKRGFRCERREAIGGHMHGAAEGEEKADGWVKWRHVPDELEQARGANSTFNSKYAYIF
jgi:hypothetical protein